MFGIGTPELIVIFIVALVVLGPKRLPEVARSIGKALAELRNATAGITDELRNTRVILEEEARAVASRAKGEAPPPRPAPPDVVAKNDNGQGSPQSPTVPPTDPTT